MRTIEQEDLKDKIFGPLSALESYISILSDYMDIHEDILEINHASLIVYKMQEELDKIKDFVDNY